MSSKENIRRVALLGVAVAALVPSLALAQAAASNLDDPADATRGGPVIPSANPETAAADEIVVTGTLIRGIAPGGTQSLTITNDAITASGVSTSSQLLANIPQANNFGSRPAVLGSSNSQLTINRPNLRNLPGTGSGGASTLVLVDGHRLVGMGVRQTSPDTDAIALGAIERVEVIPDGGSSLYGADAVGGVINFITRKRFDGVEVSGKYGFVGDYYDSWDATATVGKAWDSGSIYVSYNYAENDSIYGRDLDFVRRLDYSRPGSPPLDLNCNPANVIANGAFYVANGPALTAVAQPQSCDLSDAQTTFPSTRRHSVFAALNADLNGSATFDVRAFYMNRRSVSDAGPLTGSTQFRPLVDLTAQVGFPLVFPNAFYRSTGDANASAAQTVLFSYEPVFGPNTFQTTKLETWGITPSFRVDLGGNWQANAFFNYGRTRTSFEDREIDPFAQGTAGFLGSFNPYNIADPANATYLSTIRQANFAEAVQEMFNERIVVDGPLTTLPGGEVKVAFGGERSTEKYNLILFTGAPALIGSQIPNKTSRTVNSLFGEVSIPIFGADNRSGGFHSLTLSASGRYDHYSDFGGTFNPKFGLTYEPTSWLKIRGNWGKSFSAPSLADSDRGQPPQISIIPAVVFPAPGVTPQPGQVQIFRGGGGANLQPQKATTWSVGFDVNPPMLPDFRASLTYYNVSFTDVISIPPVFNPSVYYGQFQGYYKLYPDGITAADLLELADGTENPSAVTPYLTNLPGVYNVGRGEKANLGGAKTDGLDFSINYDRNTDFGSIFAGFTGTYILSYQEQAIAGAPFFENVDLNSKFRFVATAGAQIGNLRGQVTLQHSGGFNVDPTIYFGQDRVGAFNLVNLFFKYDVPGESMFTKGLSFTLNVDNLLDQDPPALRGAANNQFGYANGLTLGRLFQFGVSKSF